jgi:hypothetical protein
MPTKRTKITSNTFVPGADKGQMDPIFEGTVADLDEDLANQLVAAGRAVFVDPDLFELIDTTPEDKPKRGRAEG